MDVYKTISFLLFIGAIATVSADFNATTACPDPKSLNYWPPNLVATDDVGDDQFDIVIIVTDTIDNLKGNLSSLKASVEKYTKVDSGYCKEPVLIPTDAVPSGRLIFSSTGSLYEDQDDVRKFADAAQDGIKRAVDAGSKRPLLVRPEGGPFDAATMVATLAALEYLYVPYELREIGRKHKVDMLGVWFEDIDKGMEVVNTTKALEAGRTIARDIAAGDPEHMAPPNVEAYVRQVFQGSDVEMAVVSDVDTLNKDYPLLAAVNRAANVVPRHRARLIYLEYTGNGTINTTLFVVGKGITMDTGGANIKIRGSMNGMSRDKSGAGAVAGFMKVLSLLKPQNLRVVAAMPMVRNSIGEESYVVDEVITSRAGKRVRVTNADAEGRMIMADVLCKMKEMALKAVNPQLMAIATLTGHAASMVGRHYTVILDNGPAMAKNIALNMQAAGEEYGEPLEISRIRREDYQSHKGESQYDDIRQTGSSSSRGHQGPAAFLIMASGLDKHGKNSSQPLPYTHLDIAGSAKMPLKYTSPGVPVIALSGHFVLNQKIVD